MRCSRFVGSSLLAGILVTSTTAFAEDPRPPPSDWSIGAGIGSSTVLLVGSPGGLSIGTGTPQSLGLSTPVVTFPSAVVQIERRLADETFSDVAGLPV